MLLVSLLALLMLVAPAVAQDEKPTIAFLRYAGTAPVAEATAESSTRWKHTDI